MALRGAQWTNLMQRQDPTILPLWAMTRRGRNFVNISVLTLIGLGFLNGYILDGFQGMLIVGFSTWAGATILHIIFISWINLLTPLAQFYLLWPAYFVYSIMNIVSLF
ncbi:MAG: hypothetical protein P8L43_04250 [Candidatus Marinimicrobia bacterium]|nr:hypothetical protein [Candidatus Neomarinimicrobiota bacterium]